MCLYIIIKLHYDTVSERWHLLLSVPSFIYLLIFLVLYSLCELQERSLSSKPFTAHNSCFTQFLFCLFFSYIPLPLFPITSPSLSTFPPYHQSLPITIPSLSPVLPHHHSLLITNPSLSPFPPPSPVLPTGTTPSSQVDFSSFIHYLFIWVCPWLSSCCLQPSRVAAPLNLSISLLHHTLTPLHVTPLVCSPPHSVLLFPPSKPISAS